MTKQRRREDAQKQFRESFELDSLLSLQQRNWPFLLLLSDVYLTLNTLSLVAWNVGAVYRAGEGEDRRHEN